MIHDLEFEKTPVQCLSTKGHPYTKWVRIGMPRIPQEILDSVFFLYRSKEDAVNGVDAGGTGFVVSYQDHKLRETFYYGVSNRHVVCDNGYSFIRINTRSGRSDILEYDPADWETVPSGEDIAAIPLDLQQHHSGMSISPFMFLEKLERHQIGVGDDVFMLGLFIDHQGHVTNNPKARFGNISMLANPDARVEQKNGYNSESYILDMHSRAGFSGSPVFVYRTLGGDLTDLNSGTAQINVDDLKRVVNERSYGERLKIQLYDKTLFKFLGIHWGQFPEDWEIKDKSTSANYSGVAQLDANNKYVSGLSGMTCVAPAWKILEVLKMDKLQEQREKKRPKKSNGPEYESVKPSQSQKDVNPKHREDFNHLLDGAVTGKKSSD
jgi:hypothetical protein